MRDVDVARAAAEAAAAVLVGLRADGGLEGRARGESPGRRPARHRHGPGHRSAVRRPPGRGRAAAPRGEPDRPAAAEATAQALGGELVPPESAGWKTAAVVRGEVDAYVHAGGRYQWDSAAPVAVARVAGLVTVRLDGSPLRDNEPEPSLPDLLVSRPEPAETILTAVAAG